MSDSKVQTPHEVARRVLPWVLLTRFRNVITHLPLLELTPGKHEIRNIECYVTTTSPEVHVPAASSLLYVPFIKFTADTDKANKEIVVREVDGRVVGYFYDGTYRAYSIQKLEEEVRKRSGEPTTLRYEEPISRFDIESVLRTFYRFEAGKLFAAHLAAHAKKKDRITFSNLGRMKELTVVVEERGVSLTVDMKISMFMVCADDKNCFKVPGVVPGLLHLLHKGLVKPVTGEAEDVLNNTIKRISDVGDRLSPVSGGILQSTNRARFTYVVGELDKQSEEGRRRWLTEDVINGVRVGFYANERTGDIEMVTTVYPFNPPAVVVMNYPPFNLAPVTGLLRDRYWQVKRVADRAYWRLKQLGFDGAIYLREMAGLADAGISVQDVKRALREGYPRVDTVERMLDGFEKVGALGDIMSLAIGRVEKVDRLLITFLGKEEKKATEKKEEEGEEIKL